MAKKQQDNKQPKVSCLMVTANRKHLMKRSIRCFINQSYPHKELVIIDDGEQDLCEALREVPSEELNYKKLQKSPDNTLGKLRNLSLEEASGDFIIQWDDDDWYHPDRIALQAETLLKGYDACCLSGALMHLNDDCYRQHPYVGYLPDGVPGSIMHRVDPTLRYPHTRRAEDTDFLQQWIKKRYVQLPDKYSYLFIRCYHGANTWDKKHFMRRVRNNPTCAIQYFWYKMIKQNIFNHPSFQLSPKEEEAFNMYLQDSEKASLLSTNIAQAV